MPETAIKVLLVDDEEDDFIITKHRFRDFEHQKYELHWQNDFHQALSSMVAHEFDIYLLDYRLGYRNGLDLLREAVQGGCEEPIILLTGHGDIDVDIEAMKVGAADYLVKHNLTPSLMERSIRYALEKAAHIRFLRERERQLERAVLFKSFVTQVSTQFITVAVDSINDAVTTTVQKTCHFTRAERCLIYLRKHEPELLELNFQAALCADNKPAVPLLNPQDLPSITGRLLENEFVQVRSAADLQGLTGMEKKFLEQRGILALLYVPMYARGEYKGFIGIESGSASNLWDEDTPALLKMVAEVVAQALERKNIEKELIKAKEAAQEASRIKSEFLSNMSHELRTPLNSIIGMSDLISSTKLDEDQQKYVEMFRKAGNTLSNIINDILDFSGLEAHRFCLNVLDFNLKDLLKGVADKLLHTVVVKGLHLSYEVDEQVPDMISTDSNRLNQVLMHILGNAVKFTQKGDIHLRVQRDTSSTENHLLFSISDTGIGIPGSKIEQIFAGFVQGDSSLTRRFGGTGLGLTISKRIIELMEGRIWVESKEGHGSTFSFTIKIKGDSNAMVHEAVQKIPASAPHTARVLLAEDDEEMRKIMSAYLGRMNLPVVLAENGQEALMRYRTTDFDIVFMDIRMPVMDGLQATAEIRKYEKEQQHKRTPIIALTSYSLKDEVEKSLEAGCDLHLVKPVMKNALIETLKKFGLQPEVSIAPGQATGEKIAIHVDPDLKALIPGYLKKRHAEVQLIYDAFHKGDFQVIREIGHKLKGSGGGYGFGGLSKIGASLENAGKDKDGKAVEQCHHELESYLAKVNVIYDGSMTAPA